MKRYIYLILCFLFFTTCQNDPQDIENDGTENEDKSSYTDSKTDQPKEVLDANNLYNQVSLFLAGKKSEQFQELQKKDFYQNYNQKLDEAWQQSSIENLKNIEKWSAENKLQINDTIPLFYPFSGPDFLYADAFFGNARTYILVGLENPGKLPNLGKMEEVQISEYLYKLYHSLRFINQNGYFTTKQMQGDFKDSSMNGIIHLLCFYLSKTDHIIGKISYIQIDNFGKEKEKRNFELESELVNGLKIYFYSTTRQEYKTLYYFPFDLSDNNLKDRIGFMMFLNDFGLKNTFIKSASYLLHDEEFSIVRDLILKQSNRIVQDDTGIPFEKLKNSGFSVLIFGNYTQTIKIFEKYYQPALNKALSQENAKELPFKFGYNSLKNEMVLMFARQNGNVYNQPITYKTEKEGVVFKVQIKSSWKKISLTAPLFKGLPKVEYYYTDNLYKYTIGNFSNPDACEEYRQIAAKNGFTDAFVVAFYQKNRISLEEADKIIKGN